jgi:EAL domain-containing protein (putative c-di-GMP-specific phosphodiesterase class I)
MAQCQRNDLVSDVQQALANAGLPGAALVLELTESVLAHAADPLHDTLRRLHALGVTIAIDDFGTGYSNLAYLSSMEVQQLKIDQSFVRRLIHSASDRAIVEAIVAMAQKLGLDVVAEGIEHAEWAAALQAIGCHVGQGLHWSAPLSAEAFWHRFHAQSPLSIA